MASGDLTMTGPAFAKAGDATNIKAVIDAQNMARADDRMVIYDMSNGLMISLGLVEREV